MASRPKDLKPFLALGYREVGVTRGGHVLIEHPEAGRVIISSTPSDYRTRANELATAKRKITTGKSARDLLIEWLWRTYDVPKDGSVMVDARISELIDQFLTETQLQRCQGRPISRNSIEVGLRQSFYYETVEKGRGNSFDHVNQPTRFRLYGELALEQDMLSRTKAWFREREGKKDKVSPPPSTVPKSATKKAMGLEIAPGIPAELPKIEFAAPPPAPEAAPAVSGNGNGHHAPEPDDGYRPHRLGAQLVSAKDLDDLKELKELIGVLTKAVLPEQVERRELAREALQRSARTLEASQAAIGDALGEVRICLGLLEAEASASQLVLVT